MDLNRAAASNHRGFQIARPSLMCGSDHLFSRWISHLTAPVESQRNRSFLIQRRSCGRITLSRLSSNSRARLGSSSLSLTVGPMGRTLFFFHLRRCCPCPSACVGEPMPSLVPNSYVLPCIKCLQCFSPQRPSSSCSTSPPCPGKALDRP